MASLQGLPPLPKSLRGLLHAGSAQWRETERIHNMRTMIEQDLPSSNSVVHDTNSSAVNGHMESPVVHRRTKHYSQTYKVGAASKAVPTYQGVQRAASPARNYAGLDGALAQLRGEMINLRQVDMSLLCQLWTLNEGIQEHKHLLHERFSETNSECSSYGLDNGLEALASIEEYEAELEKLTHSESEDATYVEPRACVDQGCNLRSGHEHPVYQNWTKQDHTYENLPGSYESHL